MDCMLIPQHQQSTTHCCQEFFIHLSNEKLQLTRSDPALCVKSWQLLELERRAVRRKL